MSEQELPEEISHQFKRKQPILREVAKSTSTLSLSELEDENELIHSSPRDKDDPLSLPTAAENTISGYSLDDLGDSKPSVYILSQEDLLTYEQASLLQVYQIEQATGLNTTIAEELIETTEKTLDPRVAKAVSGDREAFGELYEATVDDIYRRIYSKVRTPQLAEDLTSQTYLNALKAIPKYRDMGRPFKTWLLTIADHLVADHYRLIKNYSLEVVDFLVKTEDSTALQVEDKMTQEYRVKILETAISKLTPNQKTVLALRFRDDLKFEDIATLMSTSVGAVRVTYHRVLEKLKNILSEEEIESETNYRTSSYKKDQDLQQYYLQDIRETIGKYSNYTSAAKYTPIVYEIIKKHGGISARGGNGGFLLHPDEFANVCDDVARLLGVNEERFGYKDLKMLTKMEEWKLHETVTKMRKEGILPVNESGYIGFSKVGVQIILKYLGIEAS